MFLPNLAGYYGFSNSWGVIDRANMYHA
jgi:hypothetical protein